MRITGIDHVQLAMPRGGEDEARAFYGQMLGIHEVPKPPHLATRGGCWFEDRDLKIHLGVEENFRAALKAHPALLVEDLGSLIIKLTAAGIAVEAEELAESSRVYTYDPFGNRLELMEPR
ncbi:MAG: VOC family protein [Ilumatobacteraceae bacterium]